MDSTLATLHWTLWKGKRSRFAQREWEGGALSDGFPFESCGEKSTQVLDFPLRFGLIKIGSYE